MTKPTTDPFLTYSRDDVVSILLLNAEQRLLLRCEPVDNAVGSYGGVACDSGEIEYVFFYLKDRTGALNGDAYRSRLFTVGPSNAPDDAFDTRMSVKHLISGQYLQFTLNTFDIRADMKRLRHENHRNHNDVTHVHSNQ